MREKSYLISVFVAALVICIAVLMLTFIIDPYGINHSPRIAGLNAYKADINNHSRLLKKYQSSSGEYDTLIVGNSRVEMGLDPSHACFNALGWSVYNVGVPGAGVRKQLSYALNVIYQQPIQRVFLSVDFSDFIRRPESLVSLPIPLLAVDTGELKYLPSGELNPKYTRLLLKDYSKALFSLDAVASSLRTMASQNQNSPDRDIFGFNPARDFGYAVATEGPHALFEQKMSELRKRFRGRYVLRHADRTPVSNFSDVGIFLDLAARRNIQVTIFTNPFHASYWKLLETSGMSDLYDDWKALIRALAASRASDGVEFWDFSTDTAYIHETVPAAGRKTAPLRWFWEPAHYRSTLGNLMLDSMLSEHCDSDKTFGKRAF